MEEFDNLDLLFVILTGKVSQLVNRAIIRAFKLENIDITPDQFVVMAYLWKNDGRTQQELCDQANKDKPSMTRLIDNLEKQNLVSRVADRTDRRNNLIHLTQVGKEMKNKAYDIVLRVVRQALNGVSDMQIDTCRLVLNNVLDKLK